MKIFEVYLLHFKEPYWRNCQHYVGYTRIGVDDRLLKHRNGTGAKLIKYAMKRGNDFKLEKTWKFKTQKESREHELFLKKRGGKAYCDSCKKKTSRPE